MLSRIASILMIAGLSTTIANAQLQRPPQPRTQFTVKLNTDTVPHLVSLALLDEVRRVVREGHIGFASVPPSSDSIEATIREGVDRQQALARLRELARPPGPMSGVETEKFTITDVGGVVLQLKPTQAAIAEGTARTFNQTIDVLGRRIDGLGLKPTFTREGSNLIVIQVPRDPAYYDALRLKALIVAPGKLEFRLVDTSVTVEQAKLPLGREILQDKKGTPYVVDKDAAVSGENLADAQPGVDPRNGEPVVTFRFNAKGSQQFARVTERMVGSTFAVVLDGVVLVAPVIREPILSGTGQISGGFALISDVVDLAVLLRSGALPVPVTLTEERML
jgi:preprotein translocase subunit SecD